jgi:hypothetical protein
MAIISDVLKGLGCFIVILFASDLLRTLQDIRTELRSAREEREAKQLR